MTATSTDSPKKKAPAPSPKKVSAKTTVGSSKKTEKGVEHLVTCETAAGENTCVVKITKKDLKTFAFMKPLEKEWDKVAEEFPTLKGFLGFVTLLDERGVPLAQKPGSPYSGTAMLFQLDPNGEESVEAQRKAIMKDVAAAFAKYVTPYRVRGEVGLPNRASVGWNIDRAEPRPLADMIGRMRTAEVVADFYSDFLADDTFDEHAESIVSEYFGDVEAGLILPMVKSVHENNCEGNE
jgi:hypothetical protein